MKKKFHYLIIDKYIIKKYFNKSLIFSNLKIDDLSWANGFYGEFPYYLVYNINNYNIKYNYALRIDCTNMRICADIPNLVNLCDEVLDKGLLFSEDYFKNNNKIYEYLKKNNNILLYKDLCSNNKIIKNICEYTNSLALIGDINFNNSIIEIFPKNSRLKNTYSKLIK